LPILEHCREGVESGMSGKIPSTQFPANWEFQGITADEEREMLEAEALELPEDERETYVAEGLAGSSPAMRHECYGLQWNDVRVLVVAAPFGGWQVLLEVGGELVDIPVREPLGNLAEARAAGEDALLGHLSNHERMRVLALLREREKVG
jgi:hypothetical protein